MWLLKVFFFLMHIFEPLMMSFFHFSSWLRNGTAAFPHKNFLQPGSPHGTSSRGTVLHLLQLPVWLTSPVPLFDIKEQDPSLSVFFFLEFSAHHCCVRLLVTKLSSAQSANHVSIDLKINYKYGSFFFPLRIPSDFYGSQLYPQRDTCYYLFYNIVGST